MKRNDYILEPTPIRLDREFIQLDKIEFLEVKQLQIRKIRAGDGFYTGRVD